jgi:hypothetical protein
VGLRLEQQFFHAEPKQRIKIDAATARLRHALVKSGESVEKVHNITDQEKADSRETRQHYKALGVRVRDDDYAGPHASA